MDADGQTLGRFASKVAMLVRGKYKTNFTPHVDCGDNVVVINAEKIILTSLLISSEALEIVFRSVKVETFYFQNHQELYKAILEMYTNQVPIDIVTLNTFLQDNGQLEKIGGTKVLKTVQVSNGWIHVIDDVLVPAE